MTLARRYSVRYYFLRQSVALIFVAGFPLHVMATNAPLLGNQGKKGHSKASIFYGADEYLSELRKKYAHDHEIAAMKNLLPGEADPNAAGVAQSQDKMLTVQKNDANRSLKTNRLFPTANKPDPMPQNLAFLFTKITPEQMMYMWNVLTAIFVAQVLMVVAYCGALATFPEYWWTCTLFFGIPFSYIAIQQIYIDHDVMHGATFPVYDWQKFLTHPFADFFSLPWEEFVLEHNRHHASTVDLLIQGEFGWDPEEFHYALQQWAGPFSTNWYKYILTVPWIPIIHFFGLNDTGSLFALEWWMHFPDEGAGGKCNKDFWQKWIPRRVYHNAFVLSLWAFVWLLGTYPLGRPLSEGWRFMFTVSFFARIGFSAAWMFITNFTHSLPWNEFLAQDPGRTWPVLHNVMALVLGGKHRWNEMLFHDVHHAFPNAVGTLSQRGRFHGWEKVHDAAAEVLHRGLWKPNGDEETQMQKTQKKRLTKRNSFISWELNCARNVLSQWAERVVAVFLLGRARSDNLRMQVGFTDRERLLGDSALALVKSNAKLILGFGLPFAVNYKGEPRQMSAIQVTAMFLTKLRDVTEKWTTNKVADCVIGVPSYYSDVHRQALLDAAKIAGIPVLRLMNEHTATALAYGIYRSNDFDAEKPCTVAFCNMGHTMFSVSIVQFVKGKLTVICEKADKVGGRTMTECLMREFAAQFKKKVGCDPLTNKKAAFKLEEQVTKTKKILSANMEAQLSVECLMEDEDFGSTITRDAFLEMCQPMMDRVNAVLEGAKVAAAAAGISVEQIDFVEMVGGASRVPWVKEYCSKAFGGKELSTTMNADESVARGCALQAAMLSPLYKAARGTGPRAIVRDFTVVDCTPHPVTIGWMGSSADAEAEKKADATRGEYKTMTVFPKNSLMNTVKMLTFYRKGPFDLKLEYEDTSALVPGCAKVLGNFKVDLPASADSKKIKVKAKLSLNGTFGIEGAQMLEEEEYEEVHCGIESLQHGTPTILQTLDGKGFSYGDCGRSHVEEKVKEKKEIEVPAEEKEEAKAESPKEEKPESPKGEAAPEGEAEKKEESPKKEPEKKVEWVEVIKKKKRTKRTDINIMSSDICGLSEKTLQKQQDEETAMQADMKEIIETDEKRNDLESYILTMRDKCSEGGQYGPFISSGDREKLESELMKAEDWLYDNMEATKVQYIEMKLDELKKLGDGPVFRFKEDEVREDWVNAVKGTIKNYYEAAKNPGETYGHISPDKLSNIIKECDSLTAWLNEMQAKQVATPKHEKPPLNLGFDYFFVLTIAVKNLKRRRTRIDTRVYRWK
ncbi:unnamed protein product [Durusdinium trenchii]|uniref:Uncharacterized protein n=1 Tax=Durusdinium trenchii TaxID=1381693 RepID=A0ABP0JTP8_9DINO